MTAPDPAGVHVKLTYMYDNLDNMTLNSISNSNGGSGSTSTSLYLPSGNYRSNKAEGIHEASYYSQGWKASTFIYY